MLSSCPDQRFNVPFWALKTSLFEVSGQWGRRGEKGPGSRDNFHLSKSILLSSAPPILLFPMKLMSPGQLHVVTNVYNRGTFVHQTQLPSPKQVGYLEPSAGVERAASKAAKSPLKYITVAPGFVVVVFIFEEKCWLTFSVPKRGEKEHISTLSETCNDKWNQLSQDMTHHQECFLGMK